jgi:hypothetical protein
MLDALKEVLDNLVYARSEAYSAYESIPDYDCNSSGRSYISQADSYLDRAVDDLEKVIELIEGLEEDRKKETTKNVLMGLACIVILYIWTVIMFILDGAPFHNMQ